jgi:hypothetical protein
MYRIDTPVLGFKRGRTHDLAHVPAGKLQALINAGFITPLDKPLADGEVVIPDQAPPESDHTELFAAITKSATEALPVEDALE